MVGYGRFARTQLVALASRRVRTSARARHEGGVGTRREKESVGGGGAGGGAGLVMHPPRHVRVRREEGGVVRAVVRVVPHHRKGLVLGMVRLQSVAY